ncbi:hypothetical protein HMPREF1219_00100 [Corynebacterium pyruviciproducens ATCC BAA-1742]|uniref:Pyridine nucleotide-disulfide oxidoreductase domain-containing protein 2 n=1 Tax=Corynebacterium pyruviciproducens ATCC BAA-1742 TaxID=1125779 RepID=S2ZLD6_9CORY|nr:NAD(P)/FAD-dependent oxidoreductase [Corynebacterium pyruviciproducens]EPD70807.1 hypothetical protein HMPREF1219_00100 [Corynebacterium pyruviciproducens ATCC BAA-1742]
MTTRDFVIIGGGINSLVAAAHLAESGRDVQILERNDQVGGALQSSEILGEGIEADLYATNLNLFLANPGYEKWKDKLRKLGFEPAHTTKPYCNVFPDGKAIKVYGDIEKTRAGLREHSPEDLRGFDELYSEYKAFNKAMFPLYRAPMPTAETVSLLTSGMAKVGFNKFMEVGQIVLSSTRELGDQYFHTKEMKALISTWGLHMDYGPEVSAGAMFPFMETFADMENGMTLAKGGAQNLIKAMVALIKEFGGVVTTNAEVVEILTEGDKATGVRLANGEVIEAREGVIACTGPNALYNELLGKSSAIDHHVRSKAARYQYGPATMMVHLALDAPAPWKAGDDIKDFQYVHIGPYVDDMSRTYTQAIQGALPDSPTLIVGQPTATDPSRAPEGTHVLWVQVRCLPFEPTSDAKGEITPGSWDDMKEAYADRVVDKLEEYAPGLKDHIIARDVRSPLDLQRHNPNLVHGDSVGGSHHIRQMFLFRPWLGGSTYKTPVEDLYLIGAATWPGGGLNGLSGWHLSDHLVGDSIQDRISDKVVDGVNRVREFVKRW